MDGGEEVVEHINTLYGPGQDPYEINDIPQPASRHYTAQTQPALDTVDPTYEDHNLNSYDDGYAAVSTGSPQGNGNVSQTHQPSLDHDLYSDVDVPISKPAVAVSGPATQGDEYAVVEKARKRNTEPTFQPDVYAQVNKSRPKTGGEVYAQVNKPAKRANSSPMQHDLDEGDGNYGEVQKPKPDLKPKPTLKSKPTAVRPNPKDTSDPVKTSGGDDEYNVLTFHLRNSDTPTNPDAGYRTYDRPNRRRDQDENPYTGLRPTGAAANSRTSGDVDTRGEYEEINPGGTQQTSSETQVRGHTSPGEGTELQDYTNAASVHHV
ncbi:hypothetical protein BaRGS_00011598 [Batillaria attramentaria]|uniref:Uncharacterized protein n=1 Tax=Batillaria attramentaria TaxID=370345 RepID=A0ABD0LCN9_9CAEN